MCCILHTVITFSRISTVSPHHEVYLCILIEPHYFRKYKKVVCIHLEKTYELNFSIIDDVAMSINECVQYQVVFVTKHNDIASPSYFNRKYLFPVLVISIRSVFVFERYTSLDLEFPPQTIVFHSDSTSCITAYS